MEITESEHIELRNLVKIIFNADTPRDSMEDVLEFLNKAPKEYYEILEKLTDDTGLTKFGISVWTGPPWAEIRLNYPIASSLRGGRLSVDFRTSQGKQAWAAA